MNEPAEQILHADVADLLDADLAAGELIKARQDLKLAAGLLADVHDLARVTARSGRDRENDVSHMVAACCLQNAVSAADDGNAAEQRVFLARVVVDDADDVVLALLAALELAHDHRTGGSGADEHGGAHGRALPADEAAEYAVGIADERQREKQEQQIEDRHAARKITARDIADQLLQQRRADRGKENIAQLVDAGVRPQAPVEVQQRKQENGEHGVERRCFQIDLRKAGLCQIIDAELEPEQQRCQRGEVDRKQIQKDQQHNAPMQRVVSFYRLDCHENVSLSAGRRGITGCLRAPAAIAVAIAVTVIAAGGVPAGGIVDDAADDGQLAVREDLRAFEDLPLRCVILPDGQKRAVR